MDRALRANTFDAHRLLWLATATGRQEALKQRLLEAYFTDGLNVADHEVLADCAADAGLAHHGVLAFLASDDGVAETRAELDEARQLGITAVPTYVFGGTWAVPGAQDSDTFALVLRRLGAKRAAADATAAAAGEACTDEACTDEACTDEACTDEACEV
ncbi:MAG: DsbA family protein [Ilumatobacteraceae bacterium]